MAEENKGPRRMQYSSCDDCRRARVACDAGRVERVSEQGSKVCTRCVTRGRPCTFNVRQSLLLGPIFCALTMVYGMMKETDGCCSGCARPGSTPPADPPIRPSDGTHTAVRTDPLLLRILLRLLYRQFRAYRMGELVSKLTRTSTNSSRSSQWKSENGDSASRSIDDILDPIMSQHLRIMYSETWYAVSFKTGTCEIILLARLTPRREVIFGNFLSRFSCPFT